MRLASLPTLILAAVLDSPALWHALVVRDLELRTALLRYLLAVLIASAMLWVLRMLASVAHRANAERPRPPLRVNAVAGEPIPHRRESDTRPQEATE